jgi:multiple sugar transport system substrate-binding protein
MAIQPSKTCAALICLVALCWLTASVAAPPDTLLLLSTQARPAEEAAQMRQAVLVNAPQPVDFVPVAPPELAKRIAAGRQTTEQKVDVVAALHGELLSLAELNELIPVDELAAQFTGGGLPDPLLMLGRLGTKHQFYIPWMQAGYLMVANKEALPYLPAGADIAVLSYDQLAIWAKTITDKTGKHVLGFPAGGQGLLDRFLQGFLYPSYTGGVVVPFRSTAAEAMWRWFAGLWPYVNPASTNYDSMYRPLLSGDVWIAFDHVARILPALRSKPDQFVVFPAPAGPRGRGYMPILVGLAIASGTSNMQRAAQLIDYLRRPEQQIAVARSVGFFPVVGGASLEGIEPGVREAAAGLEQTRAAKDALMTLAPVGLGEHAIDFSKVFVDTFEQIVLHKEDPRGVLGREALALQRLLIESGAHCWRPDPPSNGPCEVE